MNSNQNATPKQLPVSTYIIIAAVGFLLSLFCTYYYLHNIQGKVSEKVSQNIFYLVLIVFGIAASALIFGAMNSYGVLSGVKMDTKFQFTGPVVGVILVVLGGFYLPKGASEQSLAITVVNENHVPVTNGKITLYFAHYTREQTIDNKGLAVFSDITDDDLNNKIKFDVISEGFSRLTFDTALKNFSPLQLTLSPNREIHIYGQVTDADDRPIKDVEVLVDGSPFYSKTVNNGTYSLRVTNYSIGDEISIVTSHKNYKDKMRTIQIDKQQMTNVDFVLQPLKPNQH